LNHSALLFIALGQNKIDVADDNDDDDFGDTVHYLRPYSVDFEVRVQFLLGCCPNTSYQQKVTHRATVL